MIYSTRDRKAAIEARIANLQAELAAMEAEPDYEAWRPFLAAYLDALGNGDKPSTPFDDYDKDCIRAIQKAAPLWFLAPRDAVTAAIARLEGEQ